MDATDLRFWIIELVEGHLGLSILSSALKMYRASSGTQNKALQVLEELRLELDEEHEALIFEAINLVTGLCPPEQAIWPTSKAIQYSLLYSSV